MSLNKIATRKSYAEELVILGKTNPNLVVLDAEVGNSTYTELFGKAYPERFFQMFIAEQNMVSVALGMSLAGKIPFCATFSAFWSRAYDQIRMSVYSEPKANIKFVGTHCGVSIGHDGPSQMGLEDIHMFSSLLGSVVLYPSDDVSTRKLTAKLAAHHGLSYLRTTRVETDVIYPETEEFEIGGSKTLYENKEDKITLIAAGITLFEALKAREILKTKGVSVRIVDLYSIKPIDKAMLKKAVNETKNILTVEDHYKQGGIHAAVSESIFENNLAINGCNLQALSVTKMPRSGSTAELLAFEEIDADAIVRKVLEMVE